MLKLVKYPDPSLAVNSTPVKAVTMQLQAFAGLLLASCVEWGGIGLAAVQVGKPIQLIVIDTKHVDKSGHTLIMFNPEIISESGSDTMIEGCLSLPGEEVAVDRATSVTVNYMNIMGQQVTNTFTGLTARVIQHEYQHLFGITLMDYKV